MFSTPFACAQKPIERVHASGVVDKLFVVCCFKKRYACMIKKMTFRLHNS